MENDKVARALLIESARRGARLSIIIPIIFAITVISTILVGVFTSETQDDVNLVLTIGLGSGFSIILIFYLINWFYCKAFLKESKHLEVNDEKLNRLIKMNRVCCIIFMIPLIFFVGMHGFFIVKKWAEGKVQRGSLDQILYYFLIDRGSSKKEDAT